MANALKFQIHIIFIVLIVQFNLIVLTSPLDIATLSELVKLFTVQVISKYIRNRSRVKNFKPIFNGKWSREEKG